VDAVLPLPGGWDARGKPVNGYRRRPMTDIPPLPGFRPEPMQTANDCGPTALLAAAHCVGIALGRGTLLATWGFREGCDRLDTPGHHLRVLARLGIPVAMRRRVGPAAVARALGAGSPVVLLVPRGFLWHWVVAAGVRDGSLVCSWGDGSLREVPPGRFGRAPLANALSRGLRVDRLGYVIGRRGRPLPWERDRPLERDQLHLAALAEEWLAAAERPLVRTLREIGWKVPGREGTL